jgi:hypothetical protein
MEEDSDSQASDYVAEGGKIDDNGEEMPGVHDVTGSVRKSAGGFFTAIDSFVNRERHIRLKIDNLEARLQCADVVDRHLEMFGEIIANAGLIRSLLSDANGGVRPSMFMAMSHIFTDYIRKMRPWWAKPEDMKELKDKIDRYSEACSGNPAYDAVFLGNQIIDEFEFTAQSYVNNAGVKLQH